MNFINTPLHDLVIIEPTVYKDARGHFFESYNQKLFEEHGIFINSAQNNQSQSSYGVLRGMHCQLGKHAQAKLIRVLYGQVQDIVVDIRPSSPTFGQHFSVELSDTNFKELYVPKGFLHGFLTLSPMAIVSYKCDSFYCKESEFTVRFDDPTLNLPWQIQKGPILQSDKDQAGRNWDELLQALSAQQQ